MLFVPRGFELLKTDVRELQALIESINGIVDKNPCLEKKLGLKRKFLGVLGEAIGLVGIYEKFGEGYGYCWHGGMKKDFDLELTGRDGPIYFQIKTSADENYAFRAPRVTVENAEEVVQKLKSGRIDERESALAEINELVDRRIDDVAKNDGRWYWLFVHIKKDAYDFYMVDKEKLKEIVKQHYRDYVSRDKEPDSNYGISRTNNVWVPTLTQKHDWKLLDKHKIRCLSNK